MHESNEEPRKPKRFCSSFLLYSKDIQMNQQMRARLVAEDNPSPSKKQVKDALKEAWNASNFDKKPWTRQAQLGRNRYYQAKQNYESEMMRLGKPSKKKRKRDPNQPKGPSSAFFLYSNWQRRSLKKEHPGASNSELSKMLGTMWHNESPEVKAYYRKQAAAERAGKTELQAHDRDHEVEPCVFKPEAVRDISLEDALIVLDCLATDETSCSDNTRQEGSQPSQLIHHELSLCQEDNVSAATLDKAESEEKPPFFIQTGPVLSSETSPVLSSKRPATLTSRSESYGLVDGHPPIVDDCEAFPAVVKEPTPTEVRAVDESFQGSLNSSDLHIWLDSNDLQSELDAKHIHN